MRITRALSLAYVGLASLTTGTSAASSGCGKAAAFTNGVKTITVNGKQRQFILQLPEAYNAAHPYRIVFGWHGANDNMETTSMGLLAPPVGSFKHFGLLKPSNNTAIFVAPDALNKAWYNRNGEDIAFFDAMLEKLSGGLCVDEKAVFAIGFSHGGAFTKALSCQRPSKLRGVIILDGGGPIDGTSVCSSDPIGALVQHGVNDGIEGGRTTRDAFVKRNGCTPSTPKEPAKGSKAPHILTQYEGCKQGFPVWFNAFDGQHWMAPYDGGNGNNGEKTYTGDVAWKFITQFE